MSKKLRKDIRALSYQRKEKINKIVGHDPLVNVYPISLAVYIIFLVAGLLWPYDLSLPQKNGIKWLDKYQGVEFVRNGQIRSQGAQKYLFQQLRKGQGLSVEVWLAASVLNQIGPARIITYSMNPIVRNFMLGQDKDSLIFRLRTTETDLNGQYPAHKVKGIFDTKDIKHIVVSYDFKQQNVYIDGDKISSKCCPNGNFDNWNSSFPFSLGNEPTWDRPWLGKIFYAAVYNRALELEEVQKHFNKGQSILTRDYCNESEKYDGLVVQYCFEEGKGDIVQDSSGHNIQSHLVVPKWTHYNSSWSINKLANFRYADKNSTEVIVNIAIFIPFGFIFHAILRSRFRQTITTAILTVIFGIFLSFTFEFFQFFSFTRQSSVIDILHNCIGTGLGVAMDRFYVSQLKYSTVNIKTNAE